MVKSKTVYVCNDCGAEHTQWQGQCAACKAWNSLTKVQLGVSSSPAANANFRREGYAGETSDVKNLSDVDLHALPRYSSSINELDRVLGGGLVPGSVLLVGGNPGAGKSTVLLQIMCNLSSNGKNALYVTGEESLQQVGMRAKRLDLPQENLKILSEQMLKKFVKRLKSISQKFLSLIRSKLCIVQTFHLHPGSVSQVRESAAFLIQYAKQTNTVLILVGHVTKEGNLAGPKVLEHMIDCFVMLEGGNDTKYRILRGQKNRFGAANEIGVFAMTEKGLLEVKNPSAIFLAREEQENPGSLVMVLWEGLALCWLKFKR